MPSTRTAVYFDGHCLSDYFHITNVQRFPAGRKVGTRAVGGMDGVAVTSVNMQPITIKMQLNALQSTKAARREAMRTLYGWLDVDTPKILRFTDDDGLYYLAIPSTMGQLKVWQTADAIKDVAFYVPCPVMYGTDHEVSVNSGASKSITIGGTYPALLKVTSTAAVRNSTSHAWGVTADGGAYMRVELPSSSSTAVTIDPVQRVATVAGSAVLPTIASDWLELAPGSHTITEHGTGAYKLIWTDRWV